MVARPEVTRELERLSELPILPQILVTLNKVADDDNASAEDLGKIVLKDQGLTLQVLKVCNSAFYRQHRRERVTTVSQAVIILGFNGIRRLALGMSVYGLLKTSEQIPGLQGLWSHALTVGITARQLAARTGYMPVEEAFVAGLVHDIGRVVLARCDPDGFAKVIAGDPDSVAMREREREVYGVSHAMAGKKLAHRWSLPLALEEVIGDHHAYETQALGPASPLLRLVIGANRFTRVLMGTPDQARLEAAAEAAGRDFGLNPVQMQELYQGIWREYAELARAFDIAESAWDPGAGAAAFRPDLDRDELLARLQAISAAMVAPDGNGRVADMALDAIVAAAAVERLFLLVPDATGRGLVCRATRGRATPDEAAAFRLPLAPEGGPAARTLLEKRAFHVPDPRAPGTSRYLHPGLLAALGPHEFATVPLLFQGQALGLLWLDNPVSGRALTASLREGVATLANTLALALAGEARTAAQPQSVG